MQTLLLFLLLAWSVEPRHVPAGREEAEAGLRLEEERGDAAAGGAGRTMELLELQHDAAPKLASLKRVARGARDRHTPSLQQGHPPPPRRHDDPDRYFTTPAGNSSSAAAGGGGGGKSGSPRLLNPLFPLTDGSYWAYAIMLLALVLFAAGVVGNLALMCIVWHNLYLKSTWNCVLAGLALWDFLVLFFCLPVVVFHELTLKRLLGDLSCRLVPYLEVTSLGVATFSLCALSIDRFHMATGPGPLRTPKAEPCRSIISKLCVIWLGSMVLAAPELLLWQLFQETVSPPLLVPLDSQRGRPPGSLMAALRAGSQGRLEVDVCLREPLAELPDSVYSLVLTYHEARAWWFVGCYICLPLLFTLACDLVTRRVQAQQKPQPGKATSKCSSLTSSPSSSASKKKKQQQQQQRGREQRLRSTVLALTGLYVACNLPEGICNVVLAYVPERAMEALPPVVLPALGLAGHFLLFARCAASPVLLLVLCRSLGQAFMDCCCCCCEECLPDGCSSSSSSSASSSASTAASTAVTSNLSSPASHHPSSPSPSSREETRSTRAKDSPVGLGTPC